MPNIDMISIPTIYFYISNNGHRICSSEIPGFKFAISRGITIADLCRHITKEVAKKYQKNKIVTSKTRCVSFNLLGMEVQIGLAI